MEVKINRTGIGIGNILTLSYDWKGYSFNEETDSWIKDSDLYKDEEGRLYPFCSTIRTNRIVEIFENAPINESNILITRRHIDNTSINGYILVGDVGIKNYEFETKSLKR